MADISQIELPNGDLYNLKDGRLTGIIPVVGTQTGVTGSWTGNINIPALFDGLTIAYFLPYNGDGEATLNLTLSDNTTTGAIAVYSSGDVRTTTHYSAGSTIILTYWSAGSVSVAGQATTVARWVKADTTNKILHYGKSTWADFMAVYKTNSVIYCRASSGSNPAIGSQTRMAFMAYVNNEESPTEVEFQYYRSVNQHSITQQGDQVYVYKLNKNTGWSVTVRESYTRIVAGTDISTAYKNGILTINFDGTIPSKTSDLTNDSEFVNTTEAANAAPVQSVNSQTGTVVLSAEDVGAITEPSSHTSGDVLTYNGTAWVAQAPSGGLSADVKTALLDCFEHVAWVDEQGQTYYDALYSSLHGGLVSISVVYTQSGTVLSTDDLDVLRSDLVVTATYGDGTTRAVTAYTLSGTLNVGISTVTVDYFGNTSTISVNVTLGIIGLNKTGNETYTQDGVTYNCIATKNQRAIIVTKSSDPKLKLVTSNTLVDTEYSPIRIPSGATAVTYQFGASGWSKVNIFSYNNGYLSQAQIGSGYFVGGTDITVNLTSYNDGTYYCLPFANDVEQDPALCKLSFS